MNPVPLPEAEGEDNKKNRYYLFSFTDVVYKSITEMHFNNESSQGDGMREAQPQHSHYQTEPGEWVVRASGNRRKPQAFSLMEPVRGGRVGGNFSPILI